MRYLNKIIFINTADKSLPYAEVALDGNVHFIGTQGVGKSTLLRAILFFYNADTQKLGISREKKNYSEYYFPYQNSYIIYEVAAETGNFCVMSFRSRGRVAFRFFDGAYSKDFFLDSNGKAYESWDRTRAAFGGNTGYTRIVSSYEEYRNIIYGNNKGLAAEFRKYALLESKQYQNIPRTITNVFLNARLDAEFVKDTIIKSLNEEESKIDLLTYSQTHLKDFERDLNDIKKWTDKNRKGENLLERQAEIIIETHGAMRYLERQKIELAHQLGFALNRIKEAQPEVERQRNIEKQNLQKIINRLSELGKIFEAKRDKIQVEVGGFASRLKDIKTRREEYAVLNINAVINRVDKKSLLESRKKNLSDEKQVMTSKFLAITDRYEALLRQARNQLEEFQNNVERQKVQKEKEFLRFKADQNQRYEQILSDIDKQSKIALDTARQKEKDIETSINDKKIGIAELRNKQFYAPEIENTGRAITDLKEESREAEISILRSKELIKNIQRESELEERRIQEEADRNISQKQEKLRHCEQRLSILNNKLADSRDSLYGWLNTNMPGWENTIGKVIDEDNVLFLKGLNPEKSAEATSQFYGVKIETSAIPKEVYTLEDIEKEKIQKEAASEKLRKSIAEIRSQLTEELNKALKKFNGKVREQREAINGNEYTVNNNKQKIDKLGVELSALSEKASKERQKAIDSLQTEIGHLQEEKLNAASETRRVEESVARAKRTRKKEKEAEIKIKETVLKSFMSDAESEIAKQQQIFKDKEAEVRKKKTSELQTAGADTIRINEIEKELTELNAELIYIENNRDLVAGFYKDKRELFDKEEEFKNKKSLLEKELNTESDKYVLQKNKLRVQSESATKEADRLEKILESFENDLAAYDDFSKTEIFPSLQNMINSFSPAHKTDNSCASLIREISITDNTNTNRYLDLQEAVNRFAGNFSEDNIFSFSVKFNNRAEFFEFAGMLKEFIDENKISEYRKRVEERFAHIIRQIGNETGQLISKEGEISQVIREINNDFVARNFVGAIKSMELRTEKSANPIFNLLVDIYEFNKENVYALGTPDLFSSGDLSGNNEKAVSLLKQLIKEMAASREREITLSDSFELQFKIVENNNDTGWVEKLSHVGSEGTDVLAKAMINIMLLNVFKEKASRSNKNDFRLHCMMDEIGKLHPNNVRGILRFANDRNILLTNSSPTTYNASDYRYTYLLSKNKKNITSVVRLVKKNMPHPKMDAS